MRTLFLLCTALAGSAPSLAQSVLPAPGETAQGDVAVTIYNDNLALVQDVRQLNIPAGRSRPVVTVTTSHPSVPAVTLHVNLDVRSDIDVEPKRLALRPGAVEHVTVRRRGTTTLADVRARSSDANVAAAVTPVTVGQVYDVAVRWVGEPPRAMVRAQVTVATGDAADAAVVIPVTVRP